MKALRLFLGVTVTIAPLAAANSVHAQSSEFVNCYNAYSQELRKTPEYDQMPSDHWHYIVTNICNCYVSNRVELRADAPGASYCMNEGFAKGKEKLIRDATVMRQNQQNYGSNNGATEALIKAFGLPSSNSTTCRPIYGYDGSYQGTRCQ